MNSPGYEPYELCKQNVEFINCISNPVFKTYAASQYKTVTNAFSR